MLLLALAAIVAFRYFLGAPPPPTPADPLDEGTYTVQRVVDGDTVIIAPDVRVRLIGVDTPETVRPDHPVEPYGPEASTFTRSFLRGGTVRLTFDRERFDRYGRHLAYVWVGQRMLNEELLRAGLGRWSSTFHYSVPMKNRFEAAEQHAREAGVGIWSVEAAPNGR